MSRPRHSLSMQIAALNEAIGLARDGTKEALQDAQYTIRRVQDQRHLLAMLAKLQGDNPELFQALYTITKEFPGTQIERIGL